MSLIKKINAERDSLNAVLITGVYSHQYYSNKKNYVNAIVTKKTKLNGLLTFTGNKKETSVESPNQLEEAMQ